MALFVAVRLGFFEFQQYQLDRLTAFLDQTSDIDSVNYNLFQSRVTIGSGGPLWKGPLRRDADESQLRAVPDDRLSSSPRSASSSVSSGERS